MLFHLKHAAKKTPYKPAICWSSEKWQHKVRDKPFVYIKDSCFRPYVYTQSFCIVYNNRRLVRVYKGQGFYSRKYG